jgi:hypothetical protein
MAKRHMLVIDDLTNFEVKQNLAGSYGQGSHKSLDTVIRINIDGTASAVFRVESHGVKIGEFSSLRHAIEQYNEVR